MDVSVENSGQGAGEHGSAVPAEHASKDQLSTSGAATPSVTRRRMPWVIVLVLVILACGIGGYLWYHNHQLSSALAEQERAVAARDESVTLAQGLDEGCEEVLKDNAKLCQEFADALKQAQALTPASKEEGIDVIEDRPQTSRRQLPPSIRHVNPSKMHFSQQLATHINKPTVLSAQKLMNLLH